LYLYLFDFGIFTFGIVKAAQRDRDSALKTKNYIREYRAFLERLRQARADAGLTQNVVAHRISRPQSFVSKAESGERRVDFVELQHFARIYKKPISYFQTPRN
jgi:ribosome-binding protein aMBF1 (putative translation factor)